MPVTTIAIEETIVPGSCASGRSNIFGDQSCPTVFVVDSLEWRDYDNVVTSCAVVCKSCQPTSHMTVVCRILGIPVVRVSQGAPLIPTGEWVDVDLVGDRIQVSNQPIGPASRIHNGRSRAEVAPPAGLTYQISITNAPELVARANAVGREDIEQFFLRSELFWISMRCDDPFKYVADVGAHETSKRLADSLALLVAELAPGQVLNFRGLDMRSDQWQEGDSGLQGEANPHLGLHGARQLLARPEYLAAELAAVDLLYSRGFTQVIYSLPFLTLEDELAEVLAIRKRVCQFPIKVGVFVETPSSVFELPRLLQHDLASVYVGSKDLAQFILAADRDNPAVAQLLRPTRPAVLDAVGRVVGTCEAARVPVYVFVVPNDLRAIVTAIPLLKRISMPASDYMRLAPVLSVDAK